MTTPNFFPAIYRSSQLSFLRLINIILWLDVERVEVLSIKPHNWPIRKEKPLENLAKTPGD